MRMWGALGDRKAFSAVAFVVQKRQRKLTLRPDSDFWGLLPGKKDVVAGVGD